MIGAGVGDSVEESVVKLEGLSVGGTVGMTVG